MKTAHRTASRAKRRWVADPSTIYWVMGRHQEIPEQDLVDVTVPVRVSYECLLKRQGTSQDFHNVAAAVNVALVRSEGIDPLCVETCIKAQASLMRMMERHHRMGVWGMDGMALQDIPVALDLFEQITALSTPGQMADAMDEVLARMRRGDVYEGVQS